MKCAGSGASKRSNRMQPAVPDSRTIVLQTRDPEKLEAVWDELRRRMLLHCDDRFIKEYFGGLRHILRELVFNAIKANLKRIYLEELRGRRIDEAGMSADFVRNFRERLHEDPQSLMESVRRSAYRVQVRFDNEPAGFNITVENNSDILPGERSRVEQVLRGEAGEFDPAGDPDAEGGGLGLHMIRTILENTGLGISSLSFEAGPERTVFRLRVIAH